MKQLLLKLNQLIVIMSGFLLLFFLSSCDHPLRFAYPKYSAVQIKNFLKDSTQRAFIVQFSTPHPEKAATPIGLISYTISYKSDSVVASRSYDVLTNEADSAQEFNNGEIVLGNNMIPKQRIIDALKGLDNKVINLDSLDHLRLVPFKDASNHLAYRLVAITTSGSFFPKLPPSTDPCPPRPCVIIPSTNTSKE